MQKHTLIILVVLFTSLLFIVTLLKYLTTTTSKSHHHPVVHKVDKSPKPHFSSLSGGKISDILPKNLSNSLTKYDNSIKEREYALAKLHRYHSNSTSDENTRHSIHSHPPHPHPHPPPHPWGPGGPSTPVDPVPWMPGSDASINTLLSNITSQSSSHQTLDDDSNSGSNSDSNSGSNSSNTSHNSHTQKSIIYPDSHPANSSQNTKPHHHLLGDRLRHFGTHLLRIGHKEHRHHKHIW
jgi:hypothetical protein